MAVQTPYIEVDSTFATINSNHFTIEGADTIEGRRDEKATRVEDYLGIGNPLIYR